MTLAPEHALVLAMYLLVADGLAALWIGGILGDVGFGLVGAAAGISWWQERLRASLARLRGGETVPGLVAAGASAVDLLYIADSVLEGLVHLLLFLLLYRLYTRRTTRDVRDVGFLCFLMLVASAPGTFGIGFLFVFIGFLVPATWALMLRHVVVEGAPSPAGAATRSAAPGVAGPTGPGTGSDTIPSGRLFRLSVTAAAGTLLITATLFFVIPRIGHATLPLRMKVTRMVSGFSEQVSLGAFGAIETDSGVALRVYVPEGLVDPSQLPGLRWRGIVLDHFDGDTWTREDTERRSFRTSPRGVVELTRARGTGVLLTQEVFLEPLGTETLFAAPRALRLSTRAPALRVDRGGSLSSATAGSSRVVYTVESELETMPPRRLRGRREILSPDEQTRYRQLPPVAPRVHELARRIAGDAPDAWAAASRLSAFLQTRYRYSLVLERQTTLPPVEEFLFETQSGNCEYFAASLAVMLRSLGVPARVVNGFQRGEWNPFGRYFLVRLLDAHAWVEAHIEELGWVTLDPSPRTGDGAVAGPGALALYLDALRLRWYRYVVNWSLQDQVAAAGKVREAATTWAPALTWMRRAPETRPLVVAAVAILVVAAAGLLVWRVGTSRAPGATSRRGPPRFYARMLRLLARRGFRPAPAETAREFASRVAEAWPERADVVLAVTREYERVRFGRADLSPADVDGLEARVTRLGRRA